MTLKESDFKSTDLKLYNEDDGKYFITIGDTFAGDDFNPRLRNNDIQMLKNTGHEIVAIFNEGPYLCIRIQCKDSTEVIE